MRLAEFFWRTRVPAFRRPARLGDLYFDEGPRSKLSDVRSVAEYYDCWLEELYPDFDLGERLWIMMANFAMRALLPGSRAMYWRGDGDFGTFAPCLYNIEAKELIVDASTCSRGQWSGQAPHSIPSILEYPGFLGLVGTVVLDETTIGEAMPYLAKIKWSRTIDILVRSTAQRAEEIEALRASLQDAFDADASDFKHLSLDGKLLSKGRRIDAFQIAGAGRA